MLFGCREQQINKPPVPTDTKSKESDKDWEYLYGLELKRALQNDDYQSFSFFWIYYLEARHENKLKKLDKEEFRY